MGTGDGSYGSYLVAIRFNRGGRNIGNIFIPPGLYDKEGSWKYLMVFCFYQFIILTEIEFNKSQSVVTNLFSFIN